MKILIISYYFPPLNSIGSLRPYSWAKYWAKAGHDVTVLTMKNASKENSLNLDCSNFKIIRIESKLYNTLSKLLFKDEKIQPISDSFINKEKKREFLRYKNIINNYLKSIKRKTGIFSTIRMPDLTDIFILKFYNILKHINKYDVCISTAGPYSVHIIAYVLKRKKSFNYWIADYRDLWTQHPSLSGLYPLSIFEKAIEGIINRSADAITTVSIPLQESIKKKYKLENVFTVENGFDIDDLELSKYKPRLWNDNKIRIVYTGTVYPFTRDPTPLFLAIKQIEQSGQNNLLNNLEVIFAGSRSNLVDLIDKYQVSRYVKYIGRVNREYSLLIQRDADILLFLESDSNEGVLTGKLFEYLFSKTHIWAIGITEKSLVGKIIIDSNNGTCFGNDIEMIKAELLKYLINNKKLEKKYGNELLLQKYTRENLANKYMNILFDITGLR